MDHMTSREAFASGPTELIDQLASVSNEFIDPRLLRDQLRSYLDSDSFDGAIAGRPEERSNFATSDITIPMFQLMQDALFAVEARNRSISFSLSIEIYDLTFIK